MDLSTHGPETPEPLRQLDPGSGFITSLVAVTTNSRLLSLFFSSLPFFVLDFYSLFFQTAVSAAQIAVFYRPSWPKTERKTSPSFFSLSFMCNADSHPPPLHPAAFLPHLHPRPSSPPPLSLGFPLAPAVVCTKTDFQSVNHHVLPADGRISFAEHRGPISRVIPRV